MSSFFIKLPFLTTRKEKTIRCLYDSLLFLFMHAHPCKREYLFFFNV